MSGFSYTLQADRVVLNYEATDSEDAVRLSQLTDAVSTINLAIETEKTTRETADDDLQTQIEAAIDNLIDGAPGTLDTLNEIAGALGGEGNSNVAANILEAVTTERTARVAADVELQAAIDAEVAAREAADDVAATTAGNEHINRVAAESGLQSNIDAEETARIAADTAESVERAAQDTLLTNALADETSTRTGDVTTLQQNIDIEEADRITADNALIAADLAIEADVTALTTTVAGHSTDIGALQIGKLDNTGGAAEGEYVWAGAMKMNNYVYIGEKWRFNGHSDGTRLELEYNEGGGVGPNNWVTAMPFFSTCPSMPAASGSHVFLTSQFNLGFDLTKTYSVASGEVYELTDAALIDATKAGLLAAYTSLAPADVADLTNVFLPYVDFDYYVLEHFSPGTNCVVYKGQPLILDHNVDWMLSYCTVAGQIESKYSTILYGSRTVGNVFQVGPTSMPNSTSLLLEFPVNGSSADLPGTNIVTGDRVGVVVTGITGSGLSASMP